MNLERTVRHLNARLAAELGSLDGVHPSFKWSLCRDLFYTGPEWIEHDGRMEPVYEYVCACGINRAVHALDCHSLVLPREKQVVTSTALGLPPDNWVIARWLPPTSPYQPRQGFYAPISVDGLMMSFPPNEPPTPEVTDIFIASIRNQDTRSADQQNRDQIRAEEEAERREKARHAEMFRDILPTFGQIPGSKDCEVSYPTPESQIVRSTAPAEQVKGLV